MSDSVGSSIQGSIEAAAQKVPDGVQDAAERVQHAARDGAGELRDVIRAQPIAAVLVLFAIGYLLGRLGP